MSDRSEASERHASRIDAAKRAQDDLTKIQHAMMGPVISFAAEALKAPALVNGGSAAAMLAFIGTGRQPVTVDTIWALKLFGFGLLAAAIATGMSYVAQLAYAKAVHHREPVWDHPFVQGTVVGRRWERTGFGIHILSVFLVLVAYGCAIGGLLYVAGTLVPLPAKT